MEKEIKKYIAKLNGSRKAIIVVIIISIILAALLLAGMILFSVGNQKEYTITDVYIQTELKSSSDENGVKHSTKYLYFCTTDIGEEIVFENEDNIFFCKFNSSDILAKMRKFEQNKKPFKVKTASFRIGFFSTYQNIIKIYE